MLFGKNRNKAGVEQSRNCQRKPIEKFLNLIEGLFFACSFDGIEARNLNGMPGLI